MKIHAPSTVFQMIYSSLSLDILVRFHQVYLETFGDKTSTCIKMLRYQCPVLNCVFIQESLVAQSCRITNTTATEAGKLEILIWGEDSGYELDIILNTDVIIAQTALNGHLEVVEYLRKLDIEWDELTFALQNSGYGTFCDLAAQQRSRSVRWKEGSSSKSVMLPISNQSTPSLE